MILKVDLVFFTFYINAQDFDAFFLFFCFNYNYDGEEVEPHR